MLAHIFFPLLDVIDRVSAHVEALCKSIKQIKEDNEMEGSEQIYSSKPLSNALSTQGRNAALFYGCGLSSVWRLKLQSLQKKKQQKVARCWFVIENSRSDWCTWVSIIFLQETDFSKETDHKWDISMLVNLFSHSSLFTQSKGNLTDPRVVCRSWWWGLGGRFLLRMAETLRHLETKKTPQMVVSTESRECWKRECLYLVE